MNRFLPILIACVLLISALLPFAAWFGSVEGSGPSCDPSCTEGALVFNFMYPVGLFNIIAGLAILFYRPLKLEKFLTMRLLILLVGIISVVLFYVQNFFPTHDLLDKYFIWYLDLNEEKVVDIDVDGQWFFGMYAPVVAAIFSILGAFFVKKEQSSLLTIGRTLE